MLNAMRGLGSFIADPKAYPKCRTTHVHLAVTGLSEVGKTVFLTSLINHLKHHKPDKFVLSRKRPQLLKVDDTQPKSSDRIWRTFPFSQHQVGIASGRQYPGRTTACSRYTLAFHPDDSYWTRRRLTLYDIPGHRFADVEMVDSDYAAWSDRQLELLQTASAMAGTPLLGSANGQADLSRVDRYIKLAQSGPTEGTQEGGLIAAYKRALLDLHLGLHQYISPSSFLLAEEPPLLLEETIRRVQDAGPSLSEDSLVEQIIQQRFVGLPQEEFCPLGQSFRDAAPDLAERLSARYERYRQQVVLPIFQRLIQCDGLVVLLDMAAILSEAPAAINDTNEFLDRLLKALKPGGRILRYFLSACGVRRRIRRVAVAAAQCDRFHPDDRDQLVELVRALAKPKLANVDGLVHTEYFACAAVRSTRDAGHGRLRGTLFDGDGDAKDQPEEYAVGRLPEEWLDLDEGFPLDFNPEDYRRFPKVAPDVPKVLDAVARHVDLDRVFGFVTGWWPQAGNR